MEEVRTNYRVWGLTSGALFLLPLAAITWYAVTANPELSFHQAGVLVGAALCAGFPAALVGWLAQVVWPILIGDQSPDQHVADYGDKPPPSTDDRSTYS